jgi:hypothetical protein
VGNKGFALFFFLETKIFAKNKKSIPLGENFGAIQNTLF